jgi:CheY-like chemotaxis protein
MSDSKIFMIIDDDFEDRNLFCEAVKEINENAKCLAVGKGEDAIAMLRSGTVLRPDLIFLDLNMPGMNGRECLREIKKDSELKDIPIVIYSTSSSQKDIRETRELGAAYFQVKPSSFKSLCEYIIYFMEMNPVTQI